MVLLFLRPKYCLENVENSISKHLNSKISGGACPQTPLGSWRLPHLKSRLPPTFPVGTSTSKLIDSTDWSYVFFAFIFWCFLKCYPLQEKNRNSVVFGFVLSSELKKNLFLPIQFSRRSSRDKEKNIISCFLPSYTHQVEFFFMIFFKILAVYLLCIK